MNGYNDLAAALQAAKRNFIGGKQLFVSFQIDAQKVDRKAREWAELYGTKDEPWVRQKTHRKGLPTAKAVCGPAFLNPAMRQLLLQATDAALHAPAQSPWARERWSACALEYGPFTLACEPNRHGKQTWTWRLKPEVIDGRRHYLTRLVKAGDAAAVRNECESWLKLYPFDGGVRRQLQRTLVTSIRLWNACHKERWPTIGPNELPVSIGFRSDRI